MDEYKETLLISSFRCRMLSQKLHSLFIQYICNGRIRAPPESDLISLKSTFQLGSKTDRRAVQSKFKSWAKRMMVINYKLRLSSTGKEIIPLEKCSEVVMSIHSDAHLSIERVIDQIQEKYTWSNKNFGMDQMIVTECILKNCPSPECRRQIQNEITQRHCVKNFIKDVILASESSDGLLKNQLLSSSSLARYRASSTKTPMYPWPKLLPISNETYDPFINEDYYKMKSILSNCNFIKEQRNGLITEQISKAYRNVTPIAKNKEQFFTVKPKRVYRSRGTFRKPKNMQDFLILMRAAELSPQVYPSILKEEKTKFFGGLGLVPRTICSKRTLLKFDKEKRRKRILERQHMMYHNNRKNLRDRNKLNKIKLKEQREKRAYLEITRRQACSKPEMSYEKPISKNIDNEVELLKVITKKSPTKEINLIEISSDEDNYSAEVLPPITIENWQMQKYLDRFYTEKPNNGNLINSKSLKQSKTATFAHPEEWRFINKSNNLAQCETSTSPLKIESLPHTKVKPYLMPANMKGEVAILSTSQNNSSKLSRCDRPTSYVPIKPAINKTNGSKLMPTRGTYSILQPISNVMKLKATNRNLLLTPCSGGQISKAIGPFRLKKLKKNVIKFPKESLTTMRIQIPDSSRKPIDCENILGISDVSSDVTALQQNKELSIFKVPKGIPDHKGVSCKSKIYIDEEMSKLSKWIQMMRISMSRSVFNLNKTKSSQKLESQLNTGIALVRNIRQKLYDLEKLDTQNTSLRLY